MSVKKTLGTGVAAFGLMATGYAVAQIDAHRHPNLAKAQEYCAQASQALHVAQHQNEYDMHGHATRAEQMLGEAYREIKLAADSADHPNRQ